MKFSNYITTIKDFPMEEVYLVYSHIKKTATIIGKDTYDTIIQNKKISDNMYEKLKNMNIIVDNEKEDEKNADYYINNLKNQEDTLGLIITPTMWCNMACQYCFEPDCRKINDMTETTANRIIRWLDDLLSKKEFKLIDVQFFGGEPTQNMEILMYLYDKIGEISKNYQIPVKFSIVTNGYFDEKVLHQLLEMDIRDFQVTIDGGKYEHNIRKPGIQGEETFDIIYKNFVELSKKLKENDDTLMLRINVDETNYKSAEQLLQDLAQEIDVTKVYINICKTNWSDERYCCPNYYLTQLNELAINLGYKFEFHVGSFASCYLAKRNAIIIDQYANTYKCLLQIGNSDFSSGAIEDYYETRYPKFSDIPLDEKCKKCKYLLICHGGCKEAAYRYKGSIMKTECKYNYYEETIINDIKLYYKHFFASYLA